MFCYFVHLPYDMNIVHDAIRTSSIGDSLCVKVGYGEIQLQERFVGIPQLFDEFKVCRHFMVGIKRIF